MTGELLAGARSIGAIVLAAGSGTRFGAQKMLAPYAGQPLVSHVVAAVEQAGIEVITVVVPPGSAIVSELARFPVVFAVNHASKTGIASSIRTGIQALPDETESVLIALGDQPTITPRYLRRLVAEHAASTAPISASDYDGILAPPVIFDRALFAELLVLEGDMGARTVIDREPGRVHRVSVVDRFEDVDTPEDLAKLERRPPVGP
jgi:molybdenum cofactor cytidylyltransferase